MVRSIVSKTHQLILLAPEYSRIPNSFVNVDINYDRHQELLAEMQQVRGRLYLRDGAIEPWELSSDNRHQTPADEESWHLLALSPDGHICGCARYREHGPSDPFSKLSVAASPLAGSDIWNPLLVSAVNAEMKLAHSLNISFVEVGGWALTDEFRRSTEAIKIALSAYSLARHLGGCIGVTTATVRHSSASILRRIGGEGLKYGAIEIPSYYDPRYKCQMVILRFDSSAPNPRYSSWVDELEGVLPFSPVVSMPNKAIIHRKRTEPLPLGLNVLTWPSRHVNPEPVRSYPVVAATSLADTNSRRYDVQQSNRSSD